LLVLRRAEDAVNLLGRHLDEPVPGQPLDHVVARLRHVRALIATRDYRTAVDQVDAVLRGFRAAPTARGLYELRMISRLTRERARADRGLPLATLRRRIFEALQQDASV
jgi:hypothetical protein